MNITFRRNPRSGNLYARKKGMGLSVYKNKLGSYGWKIRDAQGQDRFSERTFPSEDEALTDLEDTIIELMFVREML